MNLRHMHMIRQSLLLVYTIHSNFVHTNINMRNVLCLINNLAGFLVVCLQHLWINWSIGYLNPSLNGHNSLTSLVHFAIFSSILALWHYEFRFLLQPPVTASLLLAIFCPYFLLLVWLPHQLLHFHLCLYGP